MAVKGQCYRFMPAPDPRRNGVQSMANRPIVGIPAGAEVSLPIAALLRYRVFYKAVLEEIQSCFSSEAHSIRRVSTAECAAKSLTSQLEDFLECFALESVQRA